MFVTDINQYLVALYRDYAAGRFTPPDAISREEYADLKSTWATSAPSAIHGFAGVACSFAGKWFDSYATNADGTDYVGAGVRWLERNRNILQRVDYVYGGYTSRVITQPGLMYCDPPYVNTTQGYSTKSFDSDAFWALSEIRANVGFTVVVSEYSAPDGWSAVWSKATKSTLNQHHAYERIEKLFVRRTT